MPPASLERRLAEVLGCDVTELTPVSERVHLAATAIYKVLALGDYADALVARLLPPPPGPSPDILAFAQKIIALTGDTNIDDNAVAVQVEQWANEILETGGAASDIDPAP